jgi:O-antigen/teichoic acid export membrane protein
MSAIKRLASQTAVYGIPSIAGRFLNYLLTYLYTRVFSTEQFGVNSEFYAYSGFFAVLLAFGMETGFFRFYNGATDTKKVFATTLRFVGGMAGLFLALVYLFAEPIAGALQYSDHKEYIYWFGWMLAIDALCAIPFARLRAENKASLFAGIKLIEIGINISINVFFLIICRKAYIENSGSFLASLYSPAIGVGYIFIANLVASAGKLLLLSPQFIDIRAGFDRQLFRKILEYSLPMVVIGFAGIINEMLDRMILKYTLPYDNTTNLQMLGIYGACYKLSIIMSLFIQAFRFAAEPFFFAQKNEANAKQVYADVLKYFTIFCVFVLLLVLLYLPVVQLFIGTEFRRGLKVVPILLMANLFLGIYVNLSVWYKLTDRTGLGALVSIGGALITVVLNFALIPYLGYMGSAWATLACYFSMAAVSYYLGQRFYPVQYDVKKIVGYPLLGLVIYGLNASIPSVNTPIPWYVTGTLFMLLFLFIAYLLDIRKSGLLSRITSA